MSVSKCTVSSHMHSRKRSVSLQEINPFTVTPLQINDSQLSLTISVIIGILKDVLHDICFQMYNV